MKETNGRASKISFVVTLEFSTHHDFIMLVKLLALFMMGQKSVLNAKPFNVVGRFIHIMFFAKQLRNYTFQQFLIPKGITGSSATILQYSMNLHKGPKDRSRSLFAQPITQQN